MRIVNRFIALLLIPCLLADTARADVLAIRAGQAKIQTQNSAIFQQEALMLPVAAALTGYAHYRLARWTTEVLTGPSLTTASLFSWDFLRHLLHEHTLRSALDWLSKQPPDIQFWLLGATTFFLIYVLTLPLVLNAKKIMQRRALSSEFLRRNQKSRGKLDPEAYSTYRYEQGVLKVWSDAMKLPVYELHKTAFQRMVTAEEGEPIGGLGVVADIPDNVQRRMDRWQVMVEKRLQDYPDLKGRISFLSAEQRHITIAPVGYGPAYANPSETEIERLGARLEEIARYRHQVEGNLGNITLHPEQGAISIELFNPAADLKRLDSLQIGMGRVVTPELPVWYYHVAFARVMDSLTEAQTDHWKEVLQGVRQDIQQDFEENGTEKLTIRELYLRSFKGFFKTSKTHKTVTLLDAQRYGNAVRKGQKILQRIFHLERPDDLQREDIETQLSAWLGLFPRIYLNDINALEAAIGMGNISIGVIQRLANNSSYIRVEPIEVTDTQLTLRLQRDHVRPGIMRGAVYVIEKYGGTLISREPLPSSDSDRPADIQLVIQKIINGVAQPMPEGMRARILRGLRLIPDIPPRETETRRVARVIDEPRRFITRHWRVVTLETDRLLGRILQTISDTGDTRIVVPRVLCQPSSSGFMQIDLTLEVPDTVRLEALRSRIELASGRGTVHDLDQTPPEGPPSPMAVAPGESPSAGAMAPGTMNLVGFTKPGPVNSWGKLYVDYTPWKSQRERRQNLQFEIPDANSLSARARIVEKLRGPLEEEEDRLKALNPALWPYLQKALRWFERDFKGLIGILEYHPSIKGVGDPRFIGVSSRFQENTAAWLHEIVEAYLRSPGLPVDAEAVARDILSDAGYRWFLDHLNKPNRDQTPLHLLARAITKDALPSEDDALTWAIRNDKPYSTILDTPPAPEPEDVHEILTPEQKKFIVMMNRLRRMQGSVETLNDYRSLKKSRMTFTGKMVREFLDFLENSPEAFRDTIDLFLKAEVDAAMYFKYVDSPTSVLNRLLAIKDFLRPLLGTASTVYKGPMINETVRSAERKYIVRGKAWITVGFRTYEVGMRSDGTSAYWDPVNEEDYDTFPFNTWITVGRTTGEPQDFRNPDMENPHFKFRITPTDGPLFELTVIDLTGAGTKVEFEKTSRGGSSSRPKGMVWLSWASVVFAWGVLWNNEERMRKALGTLAPGAEARFLRKIRDRAEEVALEWTEIPTLEEFLVEVGTEVIDDALQPFLKAHRWLVWVGTKLVRTVPAIHFPVLEKLFGDMARGGLTEFYYKALPYGINIPRARDAFDAGAAKVHEDFNLERLTQKDGLPYAMAATKEELKASLRLDPSIVESFRSRLKQFGFNQSQVIRVLMRYWLDHPRLQAAIRNEIANRPKLLPATRVSRLYYSYEANPKVVVNFRFRLWKSDLQNKISRVLGGLIERWLNGTLTPSRKMFMAAATTEAPGYSVRAGSKLFDLRRSNGWNRDEGARQVGLTPYHLWLFESGRCLLTPSMAAHVARIFGLKDPDFFWREYLDLADPEPLNVSVPPLRPGETLGFYLLQARRDMSQPALVQLFKQKAHLNLTANMITCFEEDKYIPSLEIMTAYGKILNFNGSAVWSQWISLLHQQRLSRLVSPGGEIDVVPWSFSDKLKATRAQKGWSQSALADRVGVIKRSVQFWEAGESIPRYGSFLKLCNALGWKDPRAVYVQYILPQEWRSNPARYGWLPLVWQPVAAPAAQSGHTPSIQTAFEGTRDASGPMKTLNRLTGRGDPGAPVDRFSDAGTGIPFSGGAKAAAPVDLSAELFTSRVPQRPDFNERIESKLEWAIHSQRDPAIKVGLVTSELSSKKSNASSVYQYLLVLDAQTHQLLAQDRVIVHEAAANAPLLEDLRMDARARGSGYMERGITLAILDKKLAWQSHPLLSGSAREMCEHMRENPLLHVETLPSGAYLITAAEPAAASSTKKGAIEIARDLQEALRSTEAGLGSYTREILFYGGFAEGRYDLDAAITSPDRHDHDVDISIPLMDDRAPHIRARFTERLRQEMVGIDSRYNQLLFSWDDADRAHFVTRKWTLPTYEGQRFFAIRSTSMQIIDMRTAILPAASPKILTAELIHRTPRMNRDNRSGSGPSSIDLVGKNFVNPTELSRLRNDFAPLIQRWGMDGLMREGHISRRKLNRFFRPGPIERSFFYDMQRLAEHLTNKKTPRELEKVASENLRQRLRDLFDHNPPSRTLFDTKFSGARINSLLDGGNNIRRDRSALEKLLAKIEPMDPMQTAKVLRRMLQRKARKVESQKNKRGMGLAGLMAVAAVPIAYLLSWVHHSLVSQNLVIAQVLLALTAIVAAHAAARRSLARSA